MNDFPFSVIRLIRYWYLDLVNGMWYAWIITILLGLCILFWIINLPFKESIR